MSVFFDGAKIDTLHYDGSKIASAYYDGAKVYQKNKIYGLDWKLVEVSSNHHINIGLAGPNNFVLGGGHKTTGTAARWTSTNGTTWTVNNISGYARVDIGEVGNNNFLLLVDIYLTSQASSGRQLITNANGLGGSLVNNISGMFMYSFFYGGGLYLMSASQYIYSSTNGTTWTQRGSVSNASYPVQRFCYGNGVYVGIGEGYLVYSANGTTWTQYTTPSGTANLKFTDIIFDGEKFIAVGWWNYLGRVITSTNGTTWTIRHNATTQCFGIGYAEGLYIVSLYNALLISNDGISWTQYPTTGLFRLDRIEYGNGLFIGSGHYTQRNSADYGKIALLNYP